MKILGISGSCRKDETSGVYKLVQTVLESTGMDYELISLRGKKISGCIACLGCAVDNVCKVKDDGNDAGKRVIKKFRAYLKIEDAPQITFLIRI